MREQARTLEELIASVTRDALRSKERAVSRGFDEQSIEEALQGRL